MKNAVIMAAYAWHAATADTRIPRKTIKKARLCSTASDALAIARF